jgi:MFS family permease
VSRFSRSRPVAIPLAAGMALVVAGVLPGFLIASLVPRIRADFAVSDSGLGVAIALFYGVSALCSPPAGRLVARTGPAAGFRLAAALTAAPCLAIAAVADSVHSLTLLLVIAGAGNATAGPAASALIQRAVAGHRHGVAFGAQQAGAPLASLLAGLALPALAIPFGWRWAFLATAVVAIGAAVAAPQSAGSARRSAAPARPRGLTSVHALALAAALASAAGVGFLAFLVVYGTGEGIGEAAAGLLLAAVSLVAATGRVALGWLADRRPDDPLGPVAVSLTASVMAYALLLVGGPAAIALGAVLAGGLGWTWTGVLNLAVVQRTPEAAAWAVGVLLSGLFAGAVAGPLVVGLLAEQELFTAAWITCAAFALLAALTIMAVRAAGSRAAA